MKATRLVSQSFSSIWNNKSRSVLTILGIVIGIASVISLVALGNGLEASTLDRFSSLGADRITIASQDPSVATEEKEEDPRAAMKAHFGGGGETSTEPTLAAADYQTVLNFDDINAASPQLATQGAKATTSTGSATVTLTGVDVSFKEMEELNIASGAFVNESNVSDKTKAVVISDKLSTDLYTGDAVGQQITIDEATYTVVGVLAPVDEESSGLFGNRGGGETVYIPYTTALLIAGQENFSKIIADVSSEDKVPQTAESLSTKLYDDHGVTEDNADISITIAQDTIDAISSVQNSFAGTLTGIAAISLLVGGIGIMNIMLVTVTERTREIGLRRAVGAKKRHITMQFLTESVMLTFLGGVIGVLVGMAFSTKAGDIISVGRGSSRGADITAVVDVKTIVLALTISILVGVVFGLFPAIKAARKDPVEALRYE